MNRITEKLIIEMKEYLEYDKNTGKFKWIKRKVGTSFDREPGNISDSGYRLIRFNKKLYRTHRLAWCFEYGCDWNQSLQIDHINGKRLDNTISNLRLVTPIENSKNKRLLDSNTSGCVGVSLSNGKRWRVRIDHKNETIELGTYDDFEEAVSVRKKAEKKYCYHKNHGRGSYGLVKEVIVEV